MFRNLVLAAALILGSHAMHDAFAVIRWSAAGISPASASLLWSESVAAELLHLACMRLIARSVPDGLEGTAQAIYATLGIGAATALMTFMSGILYSRLGAPGFWVMAALCAVALPLTWKLK